MRSLCDKVRSSAAAALVQYWRAISSLGAECDDLEGAANDGETSGIKYDTRVWPKRSSLAVPQHRPGGQLEGNQREARKSPLLGE